MMQDEPGVDVVVTTDEAESAPAPKSRAARSKPQADAPAAAGAGASALPARASSRALLVADFAVLAMLRLFLTAPFPFSLEYLLVDDYLYVEQARHLAEGAWLGPYDGRTLIKELGFPLFLAGSMHLGVPARIAQELLWIFACGTMVWALRRCGSSRVVTIVVTAAVMFHPAATSGSFGRVLRENVYGSQILALASLAIVLVSMTRLRARLPLALALAAWTVWTWHTREEGPWLAPILLAVVGFGLWRDARRGRLRSGSITMAVLAVAVLAGLWGYRELVTTLNERHYGARVFLESKDEDYLAAAGAIIRAEVEDEHRFHPIRDESIASLYEASPAMAELRKTFESNTYRTGWMRRENGARATNAATWTLRAAAEARGHHESPEAAKRFYRRLAEEVNAHLDEDPDRYGRRRASVVPPLRWHRWREYLDELKAAIADCWRLEMRHVGDAPTPAHVAVDGEMLETYRRVLQQDELPARPAQSERRNVLESTVRGYRLVLPWLSLAGLLGVVLHVLRHRRLTMPLVAIGILMIVVLLRCALIAFLDVWLFPGRSTYLLCALPLFTAAALIAAFAGASAMLPARALERLRALDGKRWTGVLLVAILAVGGTVLGRHLAWSGPRREVPLQLGARVTGERPMAIEAYGWRPVASASGLAFKAEGGHGALIVSPWNAQRRAEPVDLHLKGRVVRPQGDAVTIVCYGTGRDFQGEFRRNLPLKPGGYFDERVPIAATHVSGMWFGASIAAGGRLELASFELVAP